MNLLVISISLLIGITLFSNIDFSYSLEKGQHYTDYRQDFIKEYEPSKLTDSDKIISERQFKVILDEASRIIDDNEFANTMATLSDLCEKKYYESCFIDHPSWEEFFNLTDQLLLEDLIKNGLD